MLKTPITEQYGLKVPFINAGMAFIATAPLWCGQCVTRVEWGCWAFLQCPPTYCKRQSAMSKQ